MASILYISYDGLTEPLGQSQVVAYLEKLSNDNFINIISFEKSIDLSNAEKISSMQDRLNKSKIKWFPLLYHKNPTLIATLYDIFKGTIFAFYIAKKKNIEIIHARSYIPALIALLIKKYTYTKILFDIRGFWADERVDGGIWKKDGYIYKIVKRLERYLFRAADHIVTLTEASVPKIIEFGYWDTKVPKISVIPTCTDLDRFKPLLDLPKKTPFTFGYVGSIGTWYMFEETLALFSYILKIRPDARMIIVNRNDHDALRNLIVKFGLSLDRIEIIKSSYYEVVHNIQRMHAAGVLIKPCFSKIASAPTKLGEYLGCGVTCVGNKDVGDIEKIINKDKVGVVLKKFDILSLQNAAKKIVELSMNPEVRVLCRNSAIKRFSLSEGVNQYRSIYDKLTLHNK